MRTQADLATAAHSAGLSLDQIERVPLPGGAAGETTIAARMSFEDPWAAARLLQILSDQDAGDPVVRAWALAILEATAMELGEDASGPTLSVELVDAYARALHDNVQSQIRFVHEPLETFQAARVTMAAGAGDCDDHARLLYALARAGGLPARIFFLEEDEQPVHVVTLLRDSSGWRWAETTIDAEFGEDPLAAFDRLELAADRDPLSHVASIGFLGLDFVTPSDVATRKTQLEGAIESLDADMARCTMPAATEQAWTTWKAGWAAFYATAPGWLNAGAQGRQTADYAAQLLEWQNTVSASCALTGPKIPAPSRDPVVSTVTAIAVAVAIGAAAWTFAPSLRAALSRPRGRA